jgi:hypothetical protein
MINHWITGSYYTTKKDCQVCSFILVHPSLQSKHGDLIRDYRNSRLSFSSVQVSNMSYYFLVVYVGYLLMAGHARMQVIANITKVSQH